VSTPPPEPTIGDILGAALTDVLVIAEHAGRERELEARYHCSLRLARDVSPLLGFSEGEVWEALTFVSDDDLALFDTPDGWSQLVRKIASDLDTAAPAYCPTVH
jgi:hypothetical protein